MNALENAEGAILPTMAPATSPNGLQDELVGEEKAWGLSASIDLQNCDPAAIRSRNKIQAYVVALCDLIGMKRYGDCRIVHPGHARESAQGRNREPR